ncbi:hypothetical protein GCM10019017_09640 [Streptomyces showdoensis]
MCGFKAKKRPSELYEVAEKVTPFERKVVNTDSYKDVLNEYVRPLLKVKFYWYDHPAADPTASGHYFVIEVPARPSPSDGRSSHAGSPRTASSSRAAGRSQSATATPRSTSGRMRCTSW